jgi:DNA-binding transcriptional ArsR family regulator
MAGAGVKRGYVHGKSDKTASAPLEDAVHPGELLASIYHGVGIDPETIVYNHLNQPRELVKAQAVTKLFAEQRVESASFQRESLEGWAEMFGLMADRTRLRILFHLSRNDELHVGALCEKLGQSQPAVSHHLSRLREAGVLTARRDGKQRFYRLMPQRCRDVLEAAFQGLEDAKN